MTKNKKSENNLHKTLNILILKGITTSIKRYNMTSRIEYKSNELVSIFHEQSKWNLARVKFFVLFICALCKVKTVGFEKLASAFDSSASSDASLRRIQRFMATCVLDTDLIVKLIFKLLPHKPDLSPGFG